jgi:hypothetical protein
VFTVGNERLIFCATLGGRFSKTSTIAERVTNLFAITLAYGTSSHKCAYLLISITNIPLVN